MPIRRPWFLNAVLCTAALALAPPPPAALAESAELTGPRTVVEIKTPLHALPPGEGLLLRAADLRSGAKPYRVTVTFLDEEDRVVRRESERVSPGKPATSRVYHGELRSRDRFPTVRAVVEIIVAQVVQGGRTEARHRPLQHRLQVVVHIAHRV